MINPDELWELKLEVAVMKTELELVKEGVANFRSFQVTAKDFFSRNDENEKNRRDLDRKRSKIHFALLTGLISLVVTLIILIITQVIPHLSYK